MPASTYKMGPGLLTIGEVGTLKDLSCQITTATLTPSKDEEDDLKVLCGDTVPGAVTYTWALEGEMLQDSLVGTSSIIKWSWDHAGETMPFVFQPTTGAGQASIEGQLVVDPLPLGGEVGSKPTAEFEFKVLGQPTWEDQV